MHACGHDAHSASLMGIAEAFASLRAQIPGTVIFMFQPAEEGAPDGEEGGASLMVKEGVLERYKPDAAMGMHYMATLHTGDIGYRSGSLMAATDSFRIVVHGRQTHGARPWFGVDPIVTAAQIVGSLQTIVSRQVNIAANPAVITVGIIKGGVRYNIVPDEVEMIGTIRTFDAAQRSDIFARVTRTVEGVAAANGATATFKVDEGGNPSLINDAEMTLLAVPALQRSAGVGHVRAVPLETGGEDFAYITEKVPSFYFFVGITPPERALITTPTNHSPLFYVDEAGIPVGTHALAQAALTYLQAHAGH
jgi:amidohydrolase